MPIESCETIKSLVPEILQTKQESAEKNPEVVKYMNDPRIVELIEDREIRAQDLHLLEEALEVPYKYYEQNHNTASTLKDRYTEHLAHEIELVKAADDSNPTRDTADELKYLRIMAELNKSYHWTGAWQVGRKMKEITSEIQQNRAASRSSVSK